MRDTGLCSKSFRAVQWTVQFVLGVLLLWWIFTSVNLDGKQLVQIFTQASFFPLTLAALCFAISMIIKALQYHILLPPATSNVYLTGVALSQTALLTFLPWRIGEVSFPLLLRKDYNIPIMSSMSLLLVIRLVDLLIVVTVALMGSRKLGLNIHWAAIVLGIAAAVALFFVLKSMGRRARAPASLRAIIVALEPHCNAFRFGNLLLLSIGIFINHAPIHFRLASYGLAVTLPDIAFLNAVSLCGNIANTSTWWMGNYRLHPDCDFAKPSLRARSVCAYHLSNPLLLYAADPYGRSHRMAASWKNLFQITRWLPDRWEAPSATSSGTAISLPETSPAITLWRLMFMVRC